MSHQKTETEVKLVVPNSATFAALQELSLLAEFELKPIGVKIVMDRYLDTADRRLYQAGFACRLRQTNDNQILTLKALTPVEGDLHRRQEIEIELEADEFQAAQPRTWPDGRARMLVVEITGSALLETLFILHQKRHQFHALWQGRPVIEFSLDEVSLSDPAVVDYREVEAELIERGVEANLIAFITALQANWPLELERQSKFERALRVADKGVKTNLVERAEKIGDKVKKTKKTKRPDPQWVSSGPVITYPVREKIGLEPTDSLAEAGRKVLGFHFGRMLTDEPGTRLGSDIEALHDMRVATRRMRAAFRVFGAGFTKKAGKPLNSGLRTTGRVLGRVRDLDVFMEKLHQYQETLPTSEGAGLLPLLVTWSTQRDQARQEMVTYLDSDKYLRFKQEFLNFVTTAGKGAKSIPADVPTPYQLRHLVPGLIYDRYEAVHAFEVVLSNATLDMLHQLRITFKQFRYALEFFAEILGEESQRVIEEVKILQDHLGELNDARVAGDLLGNFLAEWDRNQLHLPLAERQSPAPLVAYLETRLAERQRLIATFPQAWDRFNQPDFRRNLALAISVL